AASRGRIRRWERPVVDPDDDRLLLIAGQLERRYGPEHAASRLYRLFGERKGSLFDLEARMDELRREVVADDGYVLDAGRRAAVLEEMGKAARSGARMVTKIDPTYPEALINVPYAPSALYVRGNLTDLDGSALAIVGSRRPTRDYFEFARDLSYRL